MIDNGMRAAKDRYVLNLGEVNLSQLGTKTYRIGDLPEASFVAGIEISVAPKDRVSIEKQDINPTILLELSHTDGEIVFTKMDNLNTWTWSVLVGESQAFVYGRGELGTYFQTLPRTEYTLTLTVLQANPSQLQYTALLMIKSGGWK